VEFQLDGQEFGRSAAVHFKFTRPSRCREQAAVEWTSFGKNSAGGKEVQCGWLRDNLDFLADRAHGLGELLSDKDAAKSQRVIQAMLKMVKLDIKKLKQAAKQK
jgi:predicted 3-demethylubiquinone-9 3-methyltransferase (glyoxalase superfamily)